MDTSRRNFLFSSGKIIAAGLTIPSFAYGCNNSKDPLNKVQIGAHPWVFAATQPGYDITPVLDKIFNDVKYAGFDGVELMHHPLRSNESTKLMKGLMKKYELPVIGTSYGADMWDISKHNEIQKDAEIIINNLAELNGRTLGTSVGHTKDIKTDKELDAQAEMLVSLMDMCKNNGIVLNVHNHTYEVENNMHDLRGILERIPDIKLGPDLNWLLRGGVDPLEFIKEFKNNVVFMHLRDQYMDNKWSESLGEGDFDFIAIGKELKEISFSGDLVVELAHEQDFIPTRPLRESLKMSREYIKKTMGY